MALAERSYPNKDLVNQDKRDKTREQGKGKVSIQLDSWELGASKTQAYDI